MNQVERALQNERTPEEIAAYDNNSGTQTIDDKELNFIYTGREGTGAKPISAEDRERLEQIRDKDGVIQTIVGGRHVMATPSNDPLDGIGYEFLMKKEFPNNFLDHPRINGVNAGTAYLHWRGKKYYPGGIDFQPNPDKCDESKLNLYKGPRLKPEKGNCDTWIKHTEEVICNGNAEHAKRLTQFCAHNLQKPWEKPTYAPIFISIPGTGKGTFIRPLQMILGPLMVATNGADILTGKFNSVMRGRTLIYCDEVRLDERKIVLDMRALITEPTMNMEPKFSDPQQIPNYSRFIFSANPINDSNSLHADDHERRYFVLEPSEKYVGSKQYFTDYNNWLNNGGPSHLLHYLLNYPIDDFDPFHPPETDALITQKLPSMSDVKKWFYECLEDDFTHPKLEIINSQVSGMALARHYRVWKRHNTKETCDQISAQTQIGQMLTRMGIVKKRVDTHTEYIFHTNHEMRVLFAVKLFGLRVDQVFRERYMPNNPP